MQLNLLPSSTRLLIQFDQQLRYIVKIWITAGVLAVTYLTYQLILCRDDHAKLAQLDVDCAPVLELQKKIDQQRKSLVVWQNRKATLMSLQASAHPVSILASIVQSIAAQPGKVRLQRISIQREEIDAAQRGLAQGNANGSLRNRQCIVMMGDAEDEAALSQLIQDMQRVGALDRVELKSSSRSSDSQTRQFHIEAWHTDGHPAPEQVSAAAVTGPSP